MAWRRWTIAFRPFEGDVENRLPSDMVSYFQKKRFFNHVAALWIKLQKFSQNSVNSLKYKFFFIFKPYSCKHKKIVTFNDIN